MLLKSEDKINLKTEKMLPLIKYSENCVKLSGVNSFIQLCFGHCFWMHKRNFVKSQKRSQDV